MEQGLTHIRCSVILDKWKTNKKHYFLRKNSKKIIILKQKYIQMGLLWAVWLLQIQNSEKDPKGEEAWEKTGRVQPPSSTHSFHHQVNIEYYLLSALVGAIDTKIEMAWFCPWRSQLRRKRVGYKELRKEIWILVLSDSLFLFLFFQVFL